MTPTAQLGACVFAFVISISFWSCSESSSGEPDGGAPDAGTSMLDGGAHTSQSDAGGECLEHTDCTLIARSCCSCGAASKSEVIAVPIGSPEATRDRCSGVLCGVCPDPIHDPLAAVVKPACVARRCQVVDVREEELSLCSSDAECVTASRGCCPACGHDPGAYLALRAGADAGLLACFPQPPCLPCTETGAAPAAFCASDHHCAVPAVETLAGAVSRTCVGPTQNLELAYEAGSVGCDCRVSGYGVCRPDASGRRVALVCGDDRHWHAVEDGPCQPVP